MGARVVALDRVKVCGWVLVVVAEAVPERVLVPILLKICVKIEVDVCGTV
jgi:hypothetical protein